MNFRYLLLLPSTSLITGVMMSMAVAAAPGAKPSPVMLNSHILLNKDVLTVGDLFEPAGTDADHVLARAPDVGHDLVLSRDELQRVADTYHLDWRSDDANLTATVERNAMLVTPAELTAALSKSDLAKKIEIDADIAIQSPANGLVINGQETPEISFEAVAYDAFNQTFTATAVLSRTGQKPVRAEVSGLAAKMIDVPVLTAGLERGSRISKSDITTLRLPAKDVRAIYATHLDDVVGMITRRTLDPQKPLAKNDLVPPVLVHRNEIVTVTYKTGTMALTTKARALANGVKGETVQLENPSSKKLIEAVVTGPQQTTISVDTVVAING